MVIGNGLIANIFCNYKDNDNVVIFASGVSNSNETSFKNFKRERELLLMTLEAYTDTLFVYFSSCDVIYSDSINKPYYFHKLEMESIVKRHPNYYIFRLPQIIGNSSNKMSLINYIVESIKSGDEINLWKHSYKNLIATQEVFKIVDFILSSTISRRQTINVINSYYYSIQEIVKTIEDILEIKAKVSIKDKGFVPCYSITKLTGLEIDFSKDYLRNTLLKSYGLEAGSSS